MAHIDALRLRLSKERIYLSNAKTDNERQLRSVWIKQIEKEIAEEGEFTLDAINDDDLLNALSE